MTESVSGSALLLYLGTDLRCLLDQDSLWNKAVGILAGIVGMQFRSYLFLFALAILGFTWLVKDRQLGRLRSTLILGLQVSCLAGGLLFFPCLRWLGTGHFYLPTADHWLLPFAVFNHPNLDLDSFLARPFRSETDRKYLEFLANNKLDYHQWAHLVHRMETSGQDLESLNRNFRQLAWAVRTDSLETLGNQFSLTLFSLGFSHVDFWFSPEHRINRSSKVKAWQEQNGFYYGWFSWTSASDYSPWFRDFVQRYRQKPDFYPDDAVVQLASALEPNLKNVRVKRKDPLHLAKIPPEAWFWGGIMGGLILGIRRPRVGFLLLLPVLMNYLVMLRCGLGGIRYVYWLLPTYILGATYFLASVGGLSVSWFRDRRWTFFRPAFGVGNQNPVPKVLLRNSDRGRG